MPICLPGSDHEIEISIYSRERLESLGDVILGQLLGYLLHSQYVQILLRAKIVDLVWICTPPLA